MTRPALVLVLVVLPTPFAVRPRRLRLFRMRRRRARGRGHNGERYLKLDNYVNNLRRLGWRDEDLEGPTDALVDAIVAWGDLDSVYARVRGHLDAGADHVCVQVLEEDPRNVGVEHLRALAPALLEAGS